MLLDKVDDPALRKELLSEIERLRAKRSFGLVFEAHLPERVRLREHAVRVGGTVVYHDDPESATYEVMSVADDVVTMSMVREPDGSSLAADHERRAELVEVSRDRIVVIADFGAPIHPGLRHLGSVERGGDNPSHVVIKGENHHVLEALQFTHAGKVDCIYIDPPYNTGARDWKYDNDYVDDSDAYRHSKWLAFMERRLLLAKQLLNPDNSILIVTIDEKEVHRLGLLLGQVFSGLRTQMVSVTISPRGTSRANEFSRIDEYAFFVFLGDVQLSSGSGDAGEVVEARWQYLRRDERTSTRASGRPRQFFPIYVDVSGRIAGVGSPLPPGSDRRDAPQLPGCATVFPVRADGTEMVWGLTGPALERINSEGYVRVSGGTHDLQPYTITYLRGVEKNLQEGKYSIVGEREDGSKIVVQKRSHGWRPTTSWHERAHDAGAYGTSMIGALMSGRHFPFPKSLYAVEDAIRFFVQDKPNAVVLDFFGGSGTTTHAVARLNRQDGGRRQSILVTNNEVSADEAKALRKRGLYPGDPEWEALGIFEHVTRPRVTAAITGLTPDGEPVKGDYKFTDEFPMAEGFEENVEFCELTYLDPDDVELDLAFDAIAPLLWLRAGATGPILAQRTGAFAWTDRYGVLFDADRWRAFVAERPDTATTAFVVTDSSSTFAGVAAELPDSMDVVRLYENYLTTFAITGSR
ncbi:MAG TPA: DNA methyltransferase [Acidimicrobiia bacterium]